MEPLSWRKMDTYLGSIAALSFLCQSIALTS
jgi:hypothetical protein